MTFTRRTYHRAHMRSLSIEFQLFKRSAWSMEATVAWDRQRRHTNLIRARAEREGKW